MSKFTIDLITGQELLLSGDFSSSGSTGTTTTNHNELDADSLIWTNSGHKSVSGNTLAGFNASGEPVELTESIFSNNVLPFFEQNFSSPLNLNGSVNKDFICSSITGNTIVNLNDVIDGDAGMIELIIDGTGGYDVTLGTMFTKDIGGIPIDTTADADNIIGYRVVGNNFVYNIVQVI